MKKMSSKFLTYDSGFGYLLGEAQVLKDKWMRVDNVEVMINIELVQDRFEGCL